MYDLPYHKEKNEKVIKAFISKYPFAFLTGCDAKKRHVVTQVPVFIEEREGKKILRGHIMKNTDHHKAFLDNKNVLVVFSGKDCYVSATWYANPHLPSTWNYMSVHARGNIKILDDDALVDILRLTSLHFEDQNQDSPTNFDNIPKAFREKMMKIIVGFEVEILELDTVFKLSQDRNEESYHNIIKKLREQGEDEKVIAEEMEKRAEEVFSKRS